MPKTIAAAALLGALFAGPVTGLASEPERETEREPRKDEISKPLAELAAGKRDPSTLRIDVDWFGGERIGCRPGSSATGSASGTSEPGPARGPTSLSV
jgi:hypothetical protein